MIVPIKILVVEDHPDWLKLIPAFLNEENDFEVVGTASTRKDAVELVEQLDVDVVLVDLFLTNSPYDGIYAAVEIFEKKQVKMIMLSALDANDLILKAFTAGAVQFLQKERLSELPRAIRACVQETPAFEIVLRDYRRLKREEQLQALTPAERSVYEQVQMGVTLPQMAEMMLKSERTLKNQVNSMLKKLGVSSCKEAIMKVNRRGLFTAKNQSDKKITG